MLRLTWNPSSSPIWVSRSSKSGTLLHGIGIGNAHGVRHLIDALRMRKSASSTMPSSSNLVGGNGSIPRLSHSALSCLKPANFRPAADHMPRWRGQSDNANSRVRSSRHDWAMDPREVCPECNTYRTPYQQHQSWCPRALVGVGPLAPKVIGALLTPWCKRTNPRGRRWAQVASAMIWVANYFGTARSASGSSLPRHQVRRGFTEFEAIAVHCRSCRFRGSGINESPDHILQHRPRMPERPNQPGQSSCLVDDPLRNSGSRQLQEVWPLALLVTRHPMARYLPGSW